MSNSDPSRRAHQSQPQAGGEEGVTLGRTTLTERRIVDDLEPELAGLVPTRKSSHDHLNNRLFFRLFQLGNQLERQSVAQLGITTVQWAVLGALSRDSAISGIQFSELSDYIAVTRQNLDGVLKRLERDGLVQRVMGNGDKRHRMVQLTEGGRVFWASISQRIFEFYDQAAAHFNFDERVALVHFLNVLQRDLVSADLSDSENPGLRGLRD
ncbi:MarR family winged helix-turn-helix transcriptional regulator [Sphingobium sp. YR768]|uniref:MarR family winged helix-turn-helix transcriptional regulator n=1 Tax=Sphingobium sp. YR768 TaxID=1884365 RepID=UPI0008C162D8|nr:MarR family transcriptional regulator [Sphingobium sp. YR768]SES12884.1 DNA-binding transcriptional regulator, MarR family [Sphingobium sp. YR768]